MPRLTLTHKASQGAKTVNLPKKAPKSTTARATKPHAQAGIRRPKVAGKKKAEYATWNDYEPTQYMSMESQLARFHLVVHGDDKEAITTAMRKTSYKKSDHVDEFTTLDEEDLEELSKGALAPVIKEARSFPHPDPDEFDLEQLEDVLKAHLLKVTSTAPCIHLYKPLAYPVFGTNYAYLTIRHKCTPRWAFAVCPVERHPGDETYRACAVIARHRLRPSVWIAAFVPFDYLPVLKYLAKTQQASWSNRRLHWKAADCDILPDSVQALADEILRVQAIDRIMKQITRDDAFYAYPLGADSVRYPADKGQTEKIEFWNGMITKTHTYLVEMFYGSMGNGCVPPFSPAYRDLLYHAVPGAYNIDTRDLDWDAWYNREDQVLGRLTRTANKVAMADDMSGFLDGDFFDPFYKEPVKLDYRRCGQRLGAHLQKLYEFRLTELFDETKSAKEPDAEPYLEIEQLVGHPSHPKRQRFAARPNDSARGPFTIAVRTGRPRRVVLGRGDDSDASVDDVSDAEDEAVDPVTSVVTAPAAAGASHIVEESIIPMASAAQGAETMPTAGEHTLGGSANASIPLTLNPMQGVEGTQAPSALALEVPQPVQGAQGSGVVIGAPFIGASTHLVAEHEDDIRSAEAPVGTTEELTDTSMSNADSVSMDMSAD